MSESLYCPKCNNYLMAGDGKCHDCRCGWTQSRDDERDEYWSAEVSALEENVSQLQSRNRQLADRTSDLEAERDELRAQVEAMRSLLTDARRYVDKAWPDGVHSYRANSVSGDLLGKIDAALRASHGATHEHE